MRGPIVYCVEGIDNGGSVESVRLSADEELNSEFDRELLNGVVVIRGESFTAIPYYGWANRGISPMKIWLPGM